MEQKPVAFIDARDLEDGFISASVTKTKQEATDVAVYSETVVRQLQAENEALKKDNKELHAIAQRMAMAESDARKSLQNIKDRIPHEDNLRIKPVYVEKPPVKEKDCYGDGNVYRGVRSKDSEIQTIHFNPAELTDEEIKEIFYRTTIEHTMYENDAIQFAKAILKKAQEK